MHVLDEVVCVNMIVSYLPIQDQINISRKHRTIALNQLAKKIQQWWKREKHRMTLRSVLANIICQRNKHSTHLLGSWARSMITVAKHQAYLSLTINQRVSYVQKYISTNRIDEVILWYMIDATKPRVDKTRRYGINQAMLYIIDKQQLHDIILMIQSL